MALVSQYCAHLADEGTGPGNNVDPTDVWTDLTGEVDLALTLFEGGGNWTGDGETTPYGLRNFQTLAEITSLSVDGGFAYEFWGTFPLYGAITVQEFAFDESAAVQYNASFGGEGLWLNVFAIDAESNSFSADLLTEDVLSGLHHVVLSVGSGAYSVYLDGDLVDSDSDNGVLAATGGLYVQAASDAPIHTLRLYDTALSSTEVGDLYEAGVEYVVLQLAAHAATFTLTGNALTFSRELVLPAASQTYTLTGHDTGVLYARLFGVEPNTFSLTGHDVGLSYGRVLGAEAQTFALTGVDVGLLTGRLLGAESQTYTFDGKEAAVLRGFPLSAASGTFALTGHDTTFVFYAFQPQLGALAASPLGDLTRTGAVLKRVPY